MTKHILKHWISECCGFHKIEMFNDETNLIEYYEAPIIEEKNRDYIKLN